MISYGHHQFPGKLFVVEGTDGSGKSTQLALLYQWLKAEGYDKTRQEAAPVHTRDFFIASCDRFCRSH
jgi:ABC-type lipoprotein export system ATPase subunit